VAPAGERWHEDPDDLVADELVDGRLVCDEDVNGLTGRDGNYDEC
jgi:hypothetical protein